MNDFLSLDLSPLSNLEVRMCHETSENVLLNIELFGEFVESLTDLPRIRKTAQFLAVTFEGEFLCHLTRIQQASK